MIRIIAVLSVVLLTILLFSLQTGSGFWTVHALDEEIMEEIEAVEIVDTSQNVGLLEMVGRFHPAVVHIPIGWLVMVVIIDLAAFVLGRNEFQQWGLYALTGTVLSFFPAIITGFLNASHIAVDSDIFSLMEIHRNLNVLVTIMCAAALLLRFRNRHSFEGGVRTLYLGLILLSALLLTISGHIGGKMVFGEDYLPF